MDLTNPVTDTVSLPLTHIDKVAQENPLWLMALLVLYSETPWTNSSPFSYDLHFDSCCYDTELARNLSGMNASSLMTMPKYRFSFFAFSLELYVPQCLSIGLLPCWACLPSVMGYNICLINRSPFLMSFYHSWHLTFDEALRLCDQRACNIHLVVLNSHSPIV